MIEFDGTTDREVIGVKLVLEAAKADGIISAQYNFAGYTIKTNDITVVEINEKDHRSKLEWEAVLGYIVHKKWAKENRLNKDYMELELTLAGYDLHDHFEKTSK